MEIVIRMDDRSKKNYNTESGLSTVLFNILSFCFICLIVWTVRDENFAIRKPVKKEVFPASQYHTLGMKVPKKGMKISCISEETINLMKELQEREAREMMSLNSLMNSSGDSEIHKTGLDEDAPSFKEEPDEPGTVSYTHLTLPTTPYV